MSTEKQAVKLATEGQLRQLVARFVEHEKLFEPLSRDAAQWAIRKPKEAIALCVEAIQNRSMTFDDLLAACCQDQVDSRFTESNYPLESVAMDEDDWKMVEYHFSHKVILAEGLRHLDRIAFQGEIRLPAGSRRAMEYIAAHLDAQLDHRVIFPFRASDLRIKHCLPVFGMFFSHGRKRDLLLYNLGRSIGTDCGWLVLRRKSASNNK